MGYKQVAAGTQSDMWDFENNPELEGYYLRKEEHVGKNNSNVYHMRTLDSTGEVAFWGNTVLDNQLAFVEYEKRVKITFKGLKDSKSGGRKYKDFIVEIWED